MPLKIVRHDITRMSTEAIVNTANENPVVGPGCDYAVYTAAGYEKLLAYRKERIGPAKEGDAFITPGFALSARWIIHVVSPLFIDGNHGEEERLRSCYRNALALAQEKGIQSIAFPLISTGSFGYPKEEGMRIAVDEIHAFLLKSPMQIWLVVFGEKEVSLGRNLYPDLEAYIDSRYVEEKLREETGFSFYESAADVLPEQDLTSGARRPAVTGRRRPVADGRPASGRPAMAEEPSMPGRPVMAGKQSVFGSAPAEADFAAADEDSAILELEHKLEERMAHMADTFPEYLLYLIGEKGLENADVYKRAIVDKKVFSKIKNNPLYHPQKLTALCLCIGAKLNLDESKELLARAGYALSPCDKTDIIFSYFIEHGIYDMIELDIQLEEHGLPCIIS